MSAESDIADALNDASVATYGNNLVRGPLRDGGVFPTGFQIAVQEITRVSTPTLTGSHGQELTQRSVQIMVRSDKESYGRDAADLVYATIHRNEPITYMSWWCSGPNYLEKDDSGRYIWTINVDVKEYG